MSSGTVLGGRKATKTAAMATPAESLNMTPKETKAQRAERVKAESRKQALKTKNNETQQAIAEGMRLIKKDIFQDVFDKEPHVAGRIFREGNSPL
jgi:hypothetical protein